MATNKVTEAQLSAATDQLQAAKAELDEDGNGTDAQIANKNKAADKYAEVRSQWRAQEEAAGTRTGIVTTEDGE